MLRFCEARGSPHGGVYSDRSAGSVPITNFFVMENIPQPQEKEFWTVNARDTAAYLAIQRIYGIPAGCIAMPKIPKLAGTGVALPAVGSATSSSNGKRH
jgi:hypothetical protein